MSSELFTRDDWDISVTLKTDGTAEDVSGASEIKAAIIGPSGVAAGPYTLSAGAAGADWLNGVVIVEVPSADTANIPSGGYELEIQVTTAGKKKTWPRIGISVEKDYVE